MRINSTAFLLLLLVSSAFSQVITYQDIPIYQDTRMNAQTYITSKGDTISVGDKVSFHNYEDPDMLVFFLRRKTGKKELTHKDLKKLNLTLYRVKLMEVNEDRKVILMVFDEITMLKYKLDIEAAVSSDKFVNGNKDAVRQPPLPALNNGNVRNKSSTISDAPRDTAEALPMTTRSEAVVAKDASVPLASPIPLRPRVMTDASKEMLYMSALEMKRFTRGYNRSLLLTLGGSVMTGLVNADIGSSGDFPPLAYLGIMMIIGGAVQGIYARQHIGRSGAYLEAYANGVRIRF